jgi:hypothetical protein
MWVSRIVWRLWDEFLNTCGKREFVDKRNYSLFIPSNLFGFPAQPLTATFRLLYFSSGIGCRNKEVPSGRKESSLCLHWRRRLRKGKLGKCDYFRQRCPQVLSTIKCLCINVIYGLK